MPHLFDWAIDGFGNALSSATVTVYLAGTSTSASLFSDAALTVSKTNPLTADSTGYYSAYVRPGRYKVRIEKSGFTTVEIDNVSVVAPLIDAREFGNLFSGSDVTSVLQAAIDYASDLDGGTVLVPGGTFITHQLKMRSNVDFVGQGMATELKAPNGASGGGVIELFDANTYRVRMSSFRVNGNRLAPGLASTHGIVLDNGNGVVPFGNGADPELRLDNLYVDYAGLDGFRIISRGVLLHSCRSRVAGQDGFSFLDGASVSGTDCVAVNCSSDASIRDGWHDEAGFNSVTGLKVGEAGRHGVRVEANCSTFSGVVIDNTGYPDFVADGNAVSIVGNENSFFGAINRGAAAAAIEITGGANVVHATVRQGGGSLTYGVKVVSGNSNDVQLTAEGMATGLVDPASDLTDSRVIVNGIRSGLHNPAAAMGYTDLSGTYTPTLTGVANVAASTAQVMHYIRLGSVVHVSGAVDVDPTAGTTLTQLGISLPIASNFASNIQCSGGGACNLSLADSIAAAKVVADTTNDRAELQFISEAAHANLRWSVWFTYLIV